MSFNNMSNVTTPKRNLRRTNRLQNNGNFTPFDNAGFQDDKDKSTGARVADAPTSKSKSKPQSSLAKDEKRKKYGENQPKPHRKLPNDVKTSANSKGKGSSSPSPSSSSCDKQNLVEPGFKVKDGNLKRQQQDDRKVLESINVMPSTNKQVTESKVDEFLEERDQVSPLNKKPSFMSNLRRFDATVKSKAEQPNERLKLIRPSLTLDLPNDEVDTAAFTRSASMREGKAKLKTPRRLLRDISFSDADDSVTKDYGALKNINLPHRHEKGPIDDGIESILESLMRELIKRGKVHHVAVLDLEQSIVLASVPSGLLTRGDAVGMTKSIICPPTLFKLKIGGKEYSCFKHRQDAVQGRAPDLVMVMQMTRTCVVVGFSRDDAPGSCNSEVHEFTKVLEEAGW